MNDKNEISEVNVDKSFKTKKEAEEFFLNNFTEKKPEKKIDKTVEPKMSGPTGPPKIKGPTSAPPTRAEIEKMKAKANGKNRDGVGFWEKIWQ